MTLPAVLATHISFGGVSVSPHMAHLGPKLQSRLSTVGRHTSIKTLCIAYRQITSLQAPQPCPPRMQVGRGCWRKVQHRVYYRLLHNVGAQWVSSLLLPWISPLPPRPAPAFQLELIGIPGSILAQETSCFPVRRSCFYLPPFQFTKLARTGSCTVCLGSRCIATNYF